MFNGIIKDTGTIVDIRVVSGEYSFQENLSGTAQNLAQSLDK